MLRLCSEVLVVVSLQAFYEYSLPLRILRLNIILRAFGISLHHKAYLFAIEIHIHCLPKRYRLLPLVSLHSSLFAKSFQVQNPLSVNIFQQ